MLKNHVRRVNSNGKFIDPGKYIIRWHGVIGVVLVYARHQRCNAAKPGSGKRLAGATHASVSGGIVYHSVSHDGLT